uniref:Probable galactose-1-phosphate uridylyltransferase n=1 Tax=Ascaris suum TaxID=6253 RepID=F1L8W2_ASCSU
MLMEVLKHELEVKERVVVENDEWVVVIPFWATWPFETMLLPKKHVISLNEINPEQKRLLADIIRKLLIKYDNLFQCSFPFSMGWQSAPTGRYLQEDRSFWTLRAVYLPPLLRSATVRKFMAGYELVSEPQRDITPEKAAAMLREQNEVHYLER